MLSQSNPILFDFLIEQFDLSDVNEVWLLSVDFTIKMQKSTQGV